MSGATNCDGMMAFFPPSNFMVSPLSQNEYPPLSSLLPQDFHGGIGIGRMLDKRSLSFFSGTDMCEEDQNNSDKNGGGKEEMSDDEGSLSQSQSQLMVGEKKRRLNMEQVKLLENNFEKGNKVDPQRKMELAKALGLEPRQISIWFQNRRARWKSKQLQKDYDLLKSQFDDFKAQNDALLAHNHKLKAQIMALKSGEATETINLNKETERPSSNRSENSSEINFDTHTPLDLSAHPPATAAATTTTTGIAFFPPPSVKPNGLFQSPQPLNSVKEESSFTNMFCATDDQSGFWPWLDQQNFN